MEEVEVPNQVDWIQAYYEVQTGLKLTCLEKNRR